MTWEEVGQICFDQLPLTAKHLPIAYWNGELEWQKRIRMLFTDEQRLKTRVDEVMRRFSSDRASPKIPPGILNYHVCCRFRCAKESATTAGKRSVGPPVCRQIADEKVFAFN